MNSVKNFSKNLSVSVSQYHYCQYQCLSISIISISIISVSIISISVLASLVSGSVGTWMSHGSANLAENKQRGGVDHRGGGRRPGSRPDCPPPPPRPPPLLLTKLWKGPAVSRHLSASPHNKDAAPCLHPLPHPLLPSTSSLPPTPPPPFAQVSSFYFTVTLSPFMSHLYSAS